MLQSVLYNTKNQSALEFTSTDDKIQYLKPNMQNIIQTGVNLKFTV